MPQTPFSTFAPKLYNIEQLTFAAGKGVYFTSADTPATYDLTSFGRSIAGAADAAAGRTVLGLGALATLGSINNGNWSGTALAVANGGTGATTSSGARTNLGLVIGTDVQPYSASLNLSDLQSPTILRDEFTVASTESGEIGEMGWSFTAGTWNLIPPEANHPGICRRASTAVSGTVASCYLGGGGTATILRWDQTEEQTWIIRPLTTDADYDVRVGVFSDGTANPPSNGVYFERLAADTSWYGVTRASASQTRSAALASFAGDWFKLRIRRVDASTVGFTINGGTEVTQTGNVFAGTTALVIGLQIIPTSTNARTVDVDAFCHVIPAMTR